MALSVSFREELAISFEVEGAIAEGQVDLFPQSYAAEGSHTSEPGRFGKAQKRLVGLGGIEVDAKATRTIALIGGGLAAGKGAPTDDFRESWPAVAERLLGQPVLNASQEGQSIASVVAALDAGTLRLAGVTDCLVVLGGNEAPSVDTSTLPSSLDALLSRLRSRCHVLAGTLPPQGTSPTIGESSRDARRVVNDWLRSPASAAQVVDFDVLLRDPSNPERCQPNMQDDTGGLSERAQAWMGAEMARRLGREPPEEPPRTMTVKVALTNASHDVLTVDTAGTVFAVNRGMGRAHLWASTDNARSWQPRGTHPRGSSFQVMTSLKDGTLLADTLGQDGMHALARSTDHGVTWSDVLPLGLFRMLQPGNIRELRGTVFFGEYQVFAIESPIRIWVSRNGGATWKVRATLTGRRHCHSLVADPEQGVLWAMMGDARGGLLRSVDDGVTWRTVVDGLRGVATDGIITPLGLLFGADTLYRPAIPSIRRVQSNDEMVEMTRLPGPSYSVLRLRDGGYLMGTTRETGGDVYAPGDETAHVFMSADGRTWKEFMAYPRLLPDDYARADTYWQLPSGEALLKLTNVRGIGTGFQLLESTLH
ncbi:GDSL-type esterase/lipase family protein [Myxococcus stipitatus]|uniref:GDSL-type esterase/lipase family protein n=1 Tax=Myxococcus stipitatus TaxID=83455 RepID=UPI0030D2488C